GNIILSGTYTLNKGSYVLNYQFLQRKFILTEGSTIMFSGPPLNARVDIAAEYIANTSSKELLSNEVSNADPILANSFNQKIPYHVVLKLTGILSKPDIKFDIQLPDEESNVRINSNLRTTVENKLIQLRGDESAMNKQVFSLLLLNRFIGEQSSDFFSAGQGGGFDELARQSVSQFLSSALNQIADDLIKGIDIDLSLQSYQDFSGTGSQQRTDLNLSLSKSFLNDRLTVTVGKNFGIEGEDPSGKSSTYIPDISFGYKLSADGKYMLKAYRKSQFEVVLDGYVAETGVGFLMTVDYDTFRELFRKKKKNEK
ncbi:MAG: translocation/assembly module TamB domain-containing protein, partial [Ferruginibacter sp.]